jgi:hypothetical protein
LTFFHSLLTVLSFDIFPFSFDIFVFRHFYFSTKFKFTDSRTRSDCKSTIFFVNPADPIRTLISTTVLFLLRKAISQSSFSSFHFIVGNKGYTLDPLSSLIFRWYSTVGTTRLSNSTFLCLSSFSYVSNLRHLRHHWTDTAFAIHRCLMSIKKSRSSRIRGHNIHNFLFYSAFSRSRIEVLNEKETFKISFVSEQYSDCRSTSKFKTFFVTWSDAMWTILLWSEPTLLCHDPTRGLTQFKSHTASYSHK